MSFGSWANNFRLLGENVWRFCQNCGLSVCRTTIVKDITFWRNLFLTFLLGQWTKRLWLLSKNFLRRCQNCLLFFISSTLGRSKFFLSSCRISEKFLAVWWIFFSQGWQNWILCVQRISWRKTIFLQNLYFLNQFSTPIQKYSAFCQKFCAGRVKTAFYVSIAAFWRFFFKTLTYIRKLFSAFWPIFFWEDSWKSILSVPWRILRIICLLWKSIVFFSKNSLFEQNGSTFCWNVSGRGVKAAF